MNADIAHALFQIFHIDAEQPTDIFGFKITDL